ncbi:hypothetical protein FOA52_010419 [Chlamydomonas sp. UWO 241]|nr:hypothetical protein FOA52_010419 [Chlamydomonas sp. UWO 241]
MGTHTCTNRDSARSALTSPNSEVYSGGGAPHEQKPGGNIQDVLEPKHSKEEECQAELPGGAIQAVPKWDPTTRPRADKAQQPGGAIQAVQKWLPTRLHGDEVSSDGDALHKTRADGNMQTVLLEHGKGHEKEEHEKEEDGEEWQTVPVKTKTKATAVCSGRDTVRKTEGTGSSMLSAASSCHDKAKSPNSKQYDPFNNNNDNKKTGGAGNSMLSAATSWHDKRTDKAGSPYSKQYDRFNNNNRDKKTPLSDSYSCEAETYVRMTQQAGWLPACLHWLVQWETAGRSGKATCMQATAKYNGQLPDVRKLVSALRGGVQVQFWPSQ